MNELQHLARVRDEDLAGQASGAGARALLASITAEEPAPRGRLSATPRRRRLAMGAVAVAGLAAAAVIGPAVVGGSGPATSYANSAIDIELRGGYYVAVIKDPLADHAKYSEGFKAVGLNVDLRLVPSSPSQVGRVTSVNTGVTFRTHPNEDRSIGTGREPAGCTFGRPGCAMTVMVARDYAGLGVVAVGRAAEPGEKYQNIGSATRKGEMLEGFRVDERTTGEVMAEVRRRGLRAVFEVITPAGNGGYRVEPGRQSAVVGDDWIVWEARSEQPGVVRLMVTEERLPQNPVYGRPKSEVVKD
ncbi:hypothetical protein ABZ912_18090 [Nonomuraea angiospora]|uniref:hypothetical protein n=1 Tax=Nonomuraea angiospora TaxID=46172 RepID=UPI003410294C